MTKKEKEAEEAATAVAEKKAAAKKESNKIIDKLSTIAKVVKVSMNGALQSATDVMALVHTDEKWGWADPQRTLKAVIDAKTLVDHVKSSSEVFKAWLVQDDFAKFARKHFAEELVHQELRRIEGFQVDTLNLVNEVTKLRLRHNAVPCP